MLRCPICKSTGISQYRSPNGPIWCEDCGYKVYEKQNCDQFQYPRPSEEIYILLADGDGTMRSSNEPWGVAVRTKEEAEAYVKKGGIGYTHSYCKVRIFATYEEGREYVYGDSMREYEALLKQVKK